MKLITFSLVRLRQRVRQGLIADLSSSSDKGRVISSLLSAHSWWEKVCAVVLHKPDPFSSNRGLLGKLTQGNAGVSTTVRVARKNGTIPPRHNF